MGKTAVVTGAGSGIGRAVAKTLLNAGYNVALAGRRREQLEETASGAAAALVVPTDVAKSDSVNGLFDAAKEKFGRLDLLFNNTGTNTPATPFEDLTDEQWKGVVDVNLTGMFYCAHCGSRDEGAEPAGRPHHQQRLDLRARPSATLGALHGDQARRQRPDEVDLARLPRL